jgi:hypothetical protein
VFDGDSNKGKTADKIRDSLTSGIVALYTFINCAYSTPLFPVMFLSVVFAAQVPDYQFLTVNNGQECLDMVVKNYGDGGCLNDDGTLKDNNDGSNSCDFYDQALNNAGMCCILCSAQEGDIIENCTLKSLCRGISCTFIAFIFIILSRYIYGKLLYTKLGKEYKFCGSCCDCCKIQGICQFLRLLILALLGMPKLIYKKIKESKTPIKEAKEIADTANETVHNVIS